MTINEQIARAKELIAKREEIDRQLAELFSGQATARRPRRHGVAGDTSTTEAGGEPSPVLNRETARE